MIVVTAFALISMMFLIMVRVNDPLMPRAIFGVLNTVLYFPSGAVYPQQGFPGWMQVIATVDPFTYAVHAFKSLLLKNTGFARHQRRSAVPAGVFRRRHDGRHDAVQADAVDRMKQRDRGDPRTACCAPAAQLFADRGFKKVTVRDICREARANVAAVNYHFGDKHGLYREVLQRAIDTVRATSDAARVAGDGKPAEERLRRYIHVSLCRVVAESATRAGSRG